MAVIGSMTQAMRAQAVLAKAAIRVSVIKAEAAATGRGCAYAIEYDCTQEQNVIAVLRAAGIRPKGYGGRGEE